MKRLPLQAIVVPLLAALALAFLTLPVWRWLWGEWMANDYYSHGVLIPFVSLFLAIQRVRHDPAFTWRPMHTAAGAFVLLVLSVTLYLWFLNEKAYYLAAFATIGMIAGLLWLFGGANALRRLIFPVGYLLLMVPLPFIERYTLPLALFTGVCSGALVRFLGLGVSIVGNAIALPNADLVIGAQCSGVNSLIALTALMALTAYILQGPWWGRVGLVALAAPIALLGNILRVASLLFVARGWGADAAFTFYHDYSGIIFFVIALLLLYPLARLLRCTSVRTTVI